MARRGADWKKEIKVASAKEQQQQLKERSREGARVDSVEIGKVYLVKPLRQLVVQARAAKVRSRDVEFHVLPGQKHDLSASWDGETTAVRVYLCPAFNKFVLCEGE